MRNLPSHKIQCDEIGSYVRKKQSQLKPGESPRAGDFGTFVALDPETKIVPTYFTGKRMVENACALMRDLHSRLAHRVQLSTDGLLSYVNAVEDAFAKKRTLLKVVGNEKSCPGSAKLPELQLTLRFTNTVTPQKRAR